MSLMRTPLVDDHPGQGRLAELGGQSEKSASRWLQKARSEGIGAIANQIIEKTESQDLRERGILELI